MELEIKGIPFNWPREGGKRVFGEGSLLVFFFLMFPRQTGEKNRTQQSL